jgi:hypothetical protein
MAVIKITDSKSTLPPVIKVTEGGAPTTYKVSTLSKVF